MPDGSIVRQTAHVCTEFLDQCKDADWTAPVPDLDLSVASVVAHTAEVCLWYAIDLSAEGKDLQAVEHRVKIDGANADLIDTLVTYAAVLASVVDGSAESVRGFHPMGAADPSGFAAMGCDEMLIHTDDVARGLGVDFRPPSELADQALRRLFPWVSPTGDLWNELRWANGRIALPGRPRQTNWAWHCAPLEEWDGQVTTR